MEKIVETKLCKQCNINFDITDKDLEFYDKISPKFNQKKYNIPSPRLCPKCRQQKRMAWRNERNLYKSKCALSGKDVVSVYAPNQNIITYGIDEWFSDKWNALDYGIDFDFDKGFFEQFKTLLFKVPTLCLYVAHNQNSPYVNLTANVKGCHMIYASSRNEDSYYSYWIMNNKNVIDSNNISTSENLYECIDCKNLMNSMYCIMCYDSSNCYGSLDLIGCNNCIGCYNLRNKNYYINNVKYTKKEYLKQKDKIKNYKNLLNNSIKKSVHLYTNNKNAENCFGDYIINSDSINNGFDVEKSQKCKNISNTLELNNSIDIDYQAFNTSFCYEILGTEDSNNSSFSFGVIKSNYVYYSYLNFGCSNLFGCAGLRNKEYCIFNKQYTKEEYEKIVPKIIEHMKKTGEWGEFFPPNISPFGYNETVAQEYHPLKKEKAIKSGFNWSDYKTPLPKVEKIIPAEKLPENIEDIPDDILNWAIKCEISKKPFRIIKQELEFYRKHNLPIPKRHPDTRHLDRMKLRNSRKLFDRKCDKCGINMKTTYSPDRKEIVYCEECYNKEIY